LISAKSRTAFTETRILSGAPDNPNNYHVVSFELSPHGKDTTIKLTESNLDGTVKPSDVEHRADYEKNWQTVLDGLAHIFDS
jgi:hypothetical protein